MRKKWRKKKEGIWFYGIHGKGRGLEVDVQLCSRVSLHGGGGRIFFLKYIYTPGGGNKEFSHGIANSNKRIKIKLGNIKDEINRVVCPNFGHPAPTSSFTKYKIVFQHL